LKAEEVVKKMKVLKKLYTKVASKKRPKPADEKKSEKKEEEKPVEEEEEIVVPKPKIKISIEYSRSGYLQVTKATAGTMMLDKR
jgi:hypothetical protein